MTYALVDHEGTVSIGGRTISNLHFADGIDGFTGEEEELAEWNIELESMGLQERKKNSQSET